MSKIKTIELYNSPVFVICAWRMNISMHKGYSNIQNGNLRWFSPLGVGPSAQRVGFFNIGSGRVSGGSGRSVEIYDLVFLGISFYSGVFPGSLGISGYVRYFRVYPYILRFLFNIY